LQNAGAVFARKAEYEPRAGEIVNRPPTTAKKKIGRRKYKLTVVYGGS